MGREVRRVPKDWEHPKHECGPSVGNHIPLHDGSYEAIAREWEEECAKWCTGWRPDCADAEDQKRPNTALAFAHWHGDRPTPGEYMPDWPEEERTHLQMYDVVTEGTPISPVMETPEALARWLTDNGASSLEHDTATYEQWLRVCRGGLAPSMVMDSKGLRSGVEALGDAGEE